jgi:hypothetical protein
VPWRRKHPLLTRHYHCEPVVEIWYTRLSFRYNVVVIFILTFYYESSEDPVPLNKIVKN